MRSIAIWRPPFGQGLPVPPQALPLPRNSPALEWQRKPKPPRPRIALLKLLLLKVMQLLRVALASRALAAALGVAIRWCPCCLTSSRSAQQKQNGPARGPQPRDPEERPEQAAEASAAAARDPGWPAAPGKTRRIQNKPPKRRPRPLSSTTVITPSQTSGG